MMDDLPADPRPLVSVVVPAYNEALKLMGSLTAIYDYLLTLQSRYRFELLVVDDGSTDETGDIADAFAKTHSGVMVLHHKVNFRLGQALQYAIGQSKGAYVVTFDSDLSYSVDHIGRMLDALSEQHARVVVASPYMKGGETSAIPWRRAAMSKGVNKLLSSVTHSHVATVTGMVRAYDGPFIRSLDLKAMGPEINTEILYKAQIMRARVVEVPAHLDWSDQGERMRDRKVSLRVSSTSKLLVFASFLFRPLIFFVIPGLILLVISAWTLGAVGINVVSQFFKETGSIDQRLYDAFADVWQRRPQSFIIGGFSFVVAVQLISLGLLATQTKRYFEELFHLGTSVRRRVDRIETSLVVAGVEPAEREMVAAPGMDEPVTLELGGHPADSGPAGAAAGSAENGSDVDQPAARVRSN
jgi:glycosyltransferase involved in cell wall biosynthesis